jgi:hypothetical protein
LAARALRGDSIEHHAAFIAVSTEHQAACGFGD